MEVVLKVLSVRTEQDRIGPCVLNSEVLLGQDFVFYGGCPYYYKHELSFRDIYNFRRGCDLYPLVV